MARARKRTRKKKKRNPVKEDELEKKTKVGLGQNDFSPFGLLRRLRNCEYPPEPIVETH